MLAQHSYWDRFAAAYASLGYPLRPCGEDIELVESIVRGWAATHRTSRMRALLLGVTPDLATMRWPPATNLVAIDHSFPMARRVWPGDLPGRRAVVCGDWLAGPFRQGSFHLAVGDGSLNCLAYPEGFGAVAEALAGQLREDGLLVLRCYLQASPIECPEQLFREALDGAVSSFHEFKLRLLMALQPSARDGVAVREAYQWVSRNIGLADLSRRTGWPLWAVEALLHYRNSATVYAFPTIEQFRSALAPRFEEVVVSAPRTEMGPRCPVAVFRRRCRP